MSLSKPEEPTTSSTTASISSPALSQTLPSSFRIPPSSYLTVPSSKPPSTDEGRLSDPPGTIHTALNKISSPRPSPSPPPHLPEQSRISMSVYSSTSASSQYSTYSNPPPRAYRVPSFENMTSARDIKADKDRMIQALRSHQVNTLRELRRIERDFAVIGSSDVTEPMTAAWSHYVNSHGLLMELRGLTKNFPFSSECLQEAKRRVYADPQSNRSWNLCWLVLSKIQSDQLIEYYAQYEAAQPAMWAGKTPSSDGVAQLAKAFVAEWKWAVGQLLRQWEQPPTRGP